MSISSAWIEKTRSELLKQVRKKSLGFIPVYHRDLKKLTVGQPYFSKSEPKRKGEQAKETTERNIYAT